MSYFVGGFQFRRGVMRGAASSMTVLTRKRPSAETAYSFFRSRSAVLLSTSPTGELLGILH